MQTLPMKSAGLRDPQLAKMAAIATFLGAEMGATTKPLSLNSMQLNQLANTTTDANGNAVFTFPVVPQGSTWTGTLSCAGAPATAIFVATVGTTQWGDWAGNSTVGPLQVSGPQALTVTATGLSPNTDYLVTWIGSADPSDLPAAVWPEPNVSAQSVQFGTATQLFKLQPIAFGFPGSTVRLPPTARTLLINLTSNLGISNVQVVGGTTNFNYYDQPPYLAGAGTFNNLIVVPVNPILDPTVIIRVTASAGTTSASMAVTGDTAIYDESVFYNGTTEASEQQTATSGTFVIVNGPCRLLNVGAESVGQGNVVQVVQKGNGVIMMRIQAPSTGEGAGFMAFPANVILPLGDAVDLIYISAVAGAGFAFANSAYP